MSNAEEYQVVKSITGDGARTVTPLDLALEEITRLRTSNKEMQEEMERLRQIVGSLQNDVFDLWALERRRNEGKTINNYDTTIQEQP